MLDELKWQAEQRKVSPIQQAAIDGVWQADDLVPAELKAALIKGVAKLENVPEDKRDYHPGTNKQASDCTAAKQGLSESCSPSLCLLHCLR